MAMEWTKNPGVIKGLKIGGVAVFALVSFVISIGYTLPEERIKSLIEAKAADAGIVLSIADFDASGFGGVTIEGIRAELSPLVSEAADGTRLEQPRKLEIDRMDLDVSLFSLLLGKPSFKLTVLDEGGHVGPARIKVLADSIDVEIEEIVDFPIPRGFPAGPFPLSGVIRSGKGRIQWDRAGGIAGSEGAFELKAEKVTALKPVLNTKQAGAIGLTDIALGTFEASLIIDKRSNIAALKSSKGRSQTGGEGRVIYFETLKVDGKDIKAMVEGNSLIRLASGRPLSKAQLTLEMAFAIEEAFFSKTNKDSTDTPNKFLKTLLDLDPRWKSAKSGEFYGLMCTGTLDRPNCLPRRPSVRGGDFKAPSKSAEDDEEKPVRQKASRRKPVTTRQRPAATDESAGAAGGQTGNDAPAEPVQAPEPAAPTEPQPAVEFTPPPDGPTARRPGPPDTDVDVTARVGGTAFIDRSESIRTQGEMRARPRIRLQEPGEPSEE